MKYAVLADIHGNLRALEAVLTDAKASGAQGILFLGDLIFMGLDPQLCYDLLMEEKPLVTIKGNTDVHLERLRQVSEIAQWDAQMLKLVKYADIRMNQQTKQRIAAFASVKRFDHDGLSIICCHGTPYSDIEGIYQGQPFSPALDKALSEEKVDLVLSAHTHVPADFTRNGIRFINPGAVGYSLDGDVRASYALVNIEEGMISCKIRRVEYDRERYIKEVEHAMSGFKLLERLLDPLLFGKAKT